jgi:hypothetical protein
MRLLAAWKMLLNGAANERRLGWGDLRGRVAARGRRSLTLHKKNAENEKVRGSGQTLCRRWTAADRLAGSRQSLDPSLVSEEGAFGGGFCRKPESMRSSSQCHSDEGAQYRRLEDPGEPKAIKSPDPGDLRVMMDRMTQLHAPPPLVVGIEAE